MEKAKKLAAAAWDLLGPDERAAAAPADVLARAPALAQDSLDLALGLLHGAAGGTLPRTLLITSCSDGEGKSTAAVCLARAVAGSGGGTVLLVDGRFRRPVLGDWLGTGRSPGLQEFLADGNMPADRVVRPTAIPGVRLVPAGDAPPGALLPAGTALANGLARLAAACDTLIFDGPSACRSSEVSVIARLFDGVVLVVECARTTRALASDARTLIGQSGGRVLGVVLNKREYPVPRSIYGRT